MSEFGGPAVLKLCSDVPVPVPGPRQVRRTESTGELRLQCGMKHRCREGVHSERRLMMIMLPRRLLQNINHASLSLDFVFSKKLYCKL